MKPYVGQNVVVQGQGLNSNGADEHPGIINRVWSDHMVNLTVFPDCGTPRCLTSVEYLTHSDHAAKRIMNARMSNPPSIPFLAYPVSIPRASDFGGATQASIEEKRKPDPEQNQAMEGQAASVARKP